jgi:hypothetical protein
MSEEAQEGGWSGMKKTILGIGGSAVAAVGVWVSTQVNTILGIEEEETGAATEVVQSNQQSVNVTGPEIVINVPEQKAAPAQTTVIKETVREVPAAQPAAPVEEKPETPMERMARLKKERAAQGGGQP